MIQGFGKGQINVGPGNLTPYNMSFLTEFKELHIIHVTCIILVSKSAKLYVKVRGQQAYFPLSRKGMPFQRTVRKVSWQLILSIKSLSTHSIHSLKLEMILI